MVTRGKQVFWRCIKYQLLYWRTWALELTHLCGVSAGENAHLVQTAWQQNLSLRKRPPFFFFLQVHQMDTGSVLMLKKNNSKKNSK